jgi:hypothetical protein
MAIFVHGNETYLLLTGISVNVSVQLGSHTALLPAVCKLSADQLAEIMKSHYDYAIALLVVPFIRSQLHISAENPEQLAVLAWNAQWDCLLLSALFDRDVLWNLQSDTCAEKIGPGTSLMVTHRYFTGVNARPDQQLTPSDEAWLEANIETARTLQKNLSFQTAVHSLASFHWHPHPRIRLALIWSGIEALFGVDSEVVFRVSLYTARFLAPHDESERSKIFANVKRLYKIRSAAVHGSKMKGDVQLAVQESAELLRRLIRRCVENNELPSVDSLAP